MGCARMKIISHIIATGPHAKDITYECEDLSCTDRSDAELRLKGDATYIVDANQFSTLRNFGEELVFKTRDGEEISVRNVVVLAASLVIGHKTIEHTVKYKLV